ncbi:MAG: 3-methyl-2-oxobutanoate dehydrogenase subunit beta [Candidatus Bipolaricaulota bacterium]|nr:3-methyl-2-oxobutanoate dehydrogenase subunit beta [Candidatus Bipolaricaulota bacterium]MDW8030936.1 3-methyl-2-oxobutanoate dehydrogenase subunit beta [Candidatus Bipolaricaulota bacterium]
MRNFTLPERELMGSGHLGCQGCGGALAMRYVLKALGEKTIVVIPACCWTIIAGPFPYSSLKVPVLHTAFETAAVAASGVRAALDIQGDTETTVIAWAGDGGTFDIGLQSLSGAAERNENIIYICYDNEAYMNTGIQRSGATPLLAWTTTTPEKTPKSEPKKDIMGIMVAHRIPYAATATIAYPDDFIRKVQKAKSIYGTKFLHVLAPCPPGWRAPSEWAIKLSRLAVQARVFPLYEVEDGERYTLNAPQADEPALPVSEYLKLQGRFSHLTEKDIQTIQGIIDKRWQKLLKLVQS